MTSPETIDTAVKVGKATAALKHLQQNRIEYLVLLLFSHMLGLTDMVISRTAGICGL